MIVGKVIGNLHCTRKSDNLEGNKFMIIRPIDSMRGNDGELVAIDDIGAGIGETVLVALGSAARIGCNQENAPVDAAIVGIVDDDCKIEQ